jgi:hypothetical protein
VGTVLRGAERVAKVQAFFGAGPLSEREQSKYGYPARRDSRARDHIRQQDAQYAAQRQRDLQRDMQRDTQREQDRLNRQQQAGGPYMMSGGRSVGAGMKTGSVGSRDGMMAWSMLLRLDSRLIMSVIGRPLSNPISNPISNPLDGNPGLLIIWLMGSHILNTASFGSISWLDD